MEAATAEALRRGAQVVCSAIYTDSPRDRILAAASYLFCHEGFAATGVDAVARRAGAAKTTLYKHFASKERLIEAVLETEGAAWRAWFFEEIARIPGDARARLLGLFDVLHRWFADPAFYGCPFINAIGEFATGDERIRAIASAHKAHILGWIRAQAELARLPDPARAARLFTVLIDGAIVAAQASRDPSYALEAKAAAAALFDLDEGRRR
ncbi:MAG: TetR/AcrR family transcriptional regulator [Rhodobacteraceae bacterium]|nr:MAG: TetR/AcrR family transcriptional regulator [Paracoccaceae bacterium]